MKNITVSLDDETYRKARIVAAQRDSSVSAMVKKYLLSLTLESPVPRDPKQEQEALLAAEELQWDKKMSALRQVCSVLLSCCLF